MTNLEIIILMNIYGSFGLSFVYLYLYKQYKERYMGIWAISWLLFSLRISLDLARFKGLDNFVLLVLNQAASMLSVCFLLWGMYVFRERPFPRLWIYTALSAYVFSGIALSLNLDLSLVAFPIATFFGIADIWVGIMFIRSWDIKGLGRKVTGIAMILTGLLNLSYPLSEYEPAQINHTVFFSIGALLWTIILVGVLLVYFERVRQEITKSEERFRLLAENAKDVVYRYCLYPKPYLEYISPAITNLVGYSPQELCSKPELVRNIIHSRDHNYLDNIEELNELVHKPFVQLLIHKDGHKVWTEQHVVPIYAQSGQLIALEGILRDISERKVFEQEMSRLNQMHILGETAATIAHEIRNPMTSVHGFLQLLQKKENLSQYQEWFKVMIDELERANIIISDYLSISKETKVDQQKTNINRIVTSLLPLIESTAIKESKRMVTDLKNTLEFCANERELRQLILNLCHNGLEAMSSGKTLTIQTYNTSDGIYLVIKDQGTGIDEDLIEKLGTPFFTTKERGTGLGLAVCYQVAAKHNAKIDIKTSRQGTTFTVHFKNI